MTVSKVAPVSGLSLPFPTYCDSVPVELGWAKKKKKLPRGGASKNLRDFIGFR